MLSSKIDTGSVIRFNYNNSGPDERRIGKITSVRDTWRNPIQTKTAERAPEVERSRYVITCLMSDGTYRQFYHKGLTGVEKVGIIKRTLLSLSGVRFNGVAKSEGSKARKVGQGRFRLSDGRIVPCTVED